MIKFVGAALFAALVTPVAANAQLTQAAGIPDWCPVPVAGQNFQLDKCSDYDKPLGVDLAATQPGGNYDPRKVDWKTFIEAIKYLGRKEPRFCNFAIRAHFHDAGSIAQAGGDQGVYGADGSLMLDKFEFLQPENAYDAFSAFVRSALVELSRFFKASFADMLNVAAATCTEVLGANVDIVSHCKAQDIPIYVGKLDADYAFSKDAARERVNNLPGPFTAAPSWLNFWVNKLNGNAEAAKWKFTTGEALALMGSHTLIDNQACTADTCAKGGNQRMFKWTNSYFVDTSAGECVPRSISSNTNSEGLSEWFLQDRTTNAKGLRPPPAVAKKAEACTFKSVDGLALKQDLECQLRTAAQQLGIEEIPEDDDWRFVDWFPNGQEWPCCGDLCDVCGGGEPKALPASANATTNTPSAGRKLLQTRGGPNATPFYCENAKAGTKFWFYTWQDCDLIYAVREGADVYCSNADRECGAFSGNLQTQLQDMGAAYERFASSNGQWQKEYASGHCKLNNLGAIYGPNKVALSELYTSCIGGDCSGSIQNGQIQPPQNCCGSNCPKFDVNKVIANKACAKCQ